MIDSSILQGKKAAFFTLGCKLNFAETSSVAQQLERYGVRKAQKGEVADLVVVNTCSVTERLLCAVEATRYYRNGGSGFGVGE